MRPLHLAVVFIFGLLALFQPIKSFARDKNRIPLPWMKQIKLRPNNKDTSYIRVATRHCRTADGLMAAGKYDKAIGEYKAAATTNPDRERYKTLYKEAVRKAQDFHLLRAAQGEKKRDLSFALSESELAIAHRPNLIARSKIRQLKQQMSELETEYKNISLDNTEKAYEKIKLLLVQWPTNQEFAKQLEELRMRMFQAKLNKANELLETNFKWSAARDAANKIMVNAPQYPAAKSIAEEAERRIEAHQCFSAGKKCAASGAWKKAVVEYQKCLGYYADYPNGKKQLARAISAVSSIIVKRAARAESEGDWRSVVSAYSELLTYQPDSIKYQKKLQSSKTRWAKILLADGDRLIKKDYFGMGFVYHLMAMAQDSSLYDLQHGLKVLRDRIRRRIQRRLYVKPFANNTSHPNVGGLLASLLSQYIINAAPRTVSLAQSSSNKNVMASGLVTSCEVKTNTESSTKSVQYQAGTRYVPNPQYQRALANLRKAENDLVVASGLDATDAQFRYQQAQRAINSIPPQIEQPDYAIAAHPVYTMTKVAKVSLLFKIIDTYKSRVLIQAQISDSSTASDQMVQPDPVKGVEEDPLELPDDETIIRQLVDKVAKIVEKRTNEFFRSIEKSHLNKANSLASAKKKRKAVEEYINYVFAARDLAAIEPRVFAYIAKACDLPAHIDLREYLIEQANLQ